MEANNMAQFKNPSLLADDMLREARRNTLNKRINKKGNYENYIVGGSHALDNQSRIWDTNEFAIAMNDPNSGWNTIEENVQELGELNDRYTNPEHNRKAGDAPHGSTQMKYIHRYTPSTRRGRRASDIFFMEAANGKKHSYDDLQKVQDIVSKYEGR